MVQSHPVGKYNKLKRGNHRAGDDIGRGIYKAECIYIYQSGFSQVTTTKHSLIPPHVYTSHALTTLTTITFFHFYSFSASMAVSLSFIVGIIGQSMYILLICWFMGYICLFSVDFLLYLQVI